ncbi:TPA: CPBP family intramembrane metalloprotease, partial [Pyrobaculum aerophilum]|nr:CPBP family intramembrane metalloprotease [Pyrobaculum aerophilum]
MILFFLTAFGLGWLFQLLAVYSPFWLAATMWTPALGALLEL